MHKPTGEHACLVVLHSATHHRGACAADWQRHPGVFWVAGADLAALVLPRLHDMTTSRDVV